MSINVGQPLGSTRKVVHRTVAGTDSETQVVLATNAQEMTIFNYGTGIAYVGGTGVTTAAYSFWLTPKGIHNFGAVDSGFNFYFILAANETCTLGVMEDA